MKRLLVAMIALGGLCGLSAHAAVVSPAPAAASEAAPSNAIKVWWHNRWRSHYRWGSYWHSRWRSHYRWGSYWHSRWRSHYRWGSHWWGWGWGWRHHHHHHGMWRRYHHGWGGHGGPHFMSGHGGPHFMGGHGGHHGGHHH